MSISIYNTLTRSVQEFTPINDGEVRMYCCGPTVYDYFHIGNARSFVMSDVVRRYFEFRGYKVTYVMNITDIDDKIINRGNAEGVPSTAVAEKYAAAFLEDSKRFGIRPATLHPRATETMEEIIAHIQGLIDNGAAYVVDGDVYFRVGAFGEYGKLSRKNVEDLEVGARVEADSRKERPVDFALWKSAKPGEPTWDSPWGKGRPGWHIECSAMAMKYLGTTFDIHAGGNDLIFPHHENEIAQSEALTHAPFARYWMHFGFLNIDNEKMSKSLGNFFTAREILDKYPAEVIRFYYLQTHYRSPLNFTHEGLDAAKAGLQKLQGLYRDLVSYINDPTEGWGKKTIVSRRYRDKFITAVDSDFNFSAGIGILFELIREITQTQTGIHVLSQESAQEIIILFEEIGVELLGILTKPQLNDTFRARLTTTIGEDKLLSVLHTATTLTSNVVSAKPSEKLISQYTSSSIWSRWSDIQQHRFVDIPQTNPQSGMMGFLVTSQKDSNYIHWMDNMTCRNLLQDNVVEDQSDYRKKIIGIILILRLLSKQDKKWKIADEIRDLLSNELGLILEDGKDGTKWKLGE